MRVVKRPEVSGVGWIASGSISPLGQPALNGVLVRADRHSERLATVLPTVFG